MNAAEAAEHVERYMPLALSVANHWGGMFPWLRDDFRSDAGFQLWRVAVKYDPATATIKFPTLVRLAAKRICMRRVRIERNRNRAAFGAQATETDRSLGELVDHHADGRDSVDVAEFLEKLPAAGRDAIERHYLGGETWREIARTEGVSPNAIQQRASTAIAKLPV